MKCRWMMNNERWTQNLLYEKIILILEGFKYNTLYKVYIVLQSLTPCGEMC